MVKSPAPADEAAPAGRGWRAPRAPQEAQQALPPLRRLWHALLVIAGWLLFAWSWQRVTAGRPELGELRWLMLGAVAVVPVITIGWVVHNVGIHRRKGPRRAVPEVEMAYAADFNGRRIEADWSRLVDARHIDIVIHADAKRFVAPERKPECKAARLEEVA
jgi:hypothetical protein